MNKKEIKKIVDKAVKVSFKDGNLLQNNALHFIKLFKAQSQTRAIKLLSEFLKRLKIQMKSTTMVVESVIPLSKRQKETLKRKFSSKFTITASEFTINHQILGGLKVRVGDHIYDDSIRSRIYQVREAISG